MLKNKNNKCINCGTTKKISYVMGMCVNCYQRKRYKENNEASKQYSRDRYRKKSKEWKKEHYKKNKEKLNRRGKKYYKKNKVKCLAASKKWRIENLEKYKKYQKRYKERVRIWCAEKRADDVQYRLRSNISRTINFRLKKCSSSKKGKSTIDFLPYTVEELRQHLEKQFEPWMNWGNWGKGKGCWNIDHKIPDSSFNYKNVGDKEFQKCWALENLQPLDAIENIKKGNKII